MADESPQWNEMACPKDFNSVETDKLSAPLLAVAALTSDREKLHQRYEQVMCRLAPMDHCSLASKRSSF
jgi:hypothetical protein